MNLFKLLRQLRAEKRLLQDVITALEAVCRSPADEQTKQLMHELPRGRGFLTLSPRRKAAVVRLARRVRRSAGQQAALRGSDEAARILPFLPVARYRRTAA